MHSFLLKFILAQSLVMSVDGVDIKTKEAKMRLTIVNNMSLCLLRSTLLTQYFRFCHLLSINPQVAFSIFLKFEGRRNIDSYRTFILNRRSNLGTDDLISGGKEHKRSMPELKNSGCIVEKLFNFISLA